MDEQAPRGWHSRGYLPHFDGGEIPQFVTIRLHDAVPADVIRRWNAELEQTESDTTLRALLLHRKLETFADQGHGECWLRNESVAALVEGALQHFDGDRYRLMAWVVMPNHVHFLLTPLAGHSLSRIMQSLKTWTAQGAGSRTLLSAVFLHHQD
ncbi:MAG: transposase [Acidobacteriota bacterium]